MSEATKAMEDASLAHPLPARMRSPTRPESAFIPTGRVGRCREELPLVQEGTCVPSPRPLA